MEQIGASGRYTVLLDKDAVAHAAEHYGYTPASETTFQFDLQQLLEFVGMFADDMTHCGLDYTGVVVNGDVVNMCGLFERKGRWARQHTE